MMVAHCSLTHTGNVKIHYTGEKPKPKLQTESMKRISAVLETNKGRETRKSRTKSYWYKNYIQEKSWKRYRKNQQKGVVSKESYRLLPDNLTEEEMEMSYNLDQYLEDCYN